MKRRLAIVQSATLCFLPLCLLADEKEKSEYSPYLDDFPKQVFFGDTHGHTSYSEDAGFVATLRLED